MRGKSINRLEETLEICFCKLPREFCGSVDQTRSAHDHSSGTLEAENAFCREAR